MLIWLLGIARNPLSILCNDACPFCDNCIFLLLFTCMVQLLIICSSTFSCLSKLCFPPSILIVHGPQIDHLFLPLFYWLCGCMQQCFMNQVSPGDVWALFDYSWKHAFSQQFCPPPPPFSSFWAPSITWSFYSFLCQLQLIVLFLNSTNSLLLFMERLTTGSGMVLTQIVRRSEKLLGFALPYVLLDGSCGMRIIINAIWRKCRNPNDLTVLESQATSCPDIALFCAYWDAD